jgi:hypothetical protein
MASGTISTRPAAESAPPQGRYGDFIQQRLEQTRRQVRLVDFGSGIVLLLAASLLFFLLVALADHWLFAHGLNFAVRLILFVVWMSAAGWFLWRSVAPAIMHRINPVFAAQTIEQGRPTLKNSLINFLLLRAHPENVAPVVYQAMEHRAAADLSRVPVDQAVDHRRFIHLCYVLAGAVVLFALYLALSPKNPLVSAARVMFPWASLPAPTRVHIENVQPGDKVVYQGEPEMISARISGLRDGEDVSLLISTADGQVIDDRMTMNRTGEDNRYSCKLPPGSGGLLQTTSYRITAGDATTQQYKLDVEIPPTITIDQVDYHYPPYAGMKDRTIKGQGDIDALEGTRVTIHATANVEIETAQVDLGATGLQLVTMSHHGKQATGEFTLAASQEQGKAWKPLYDRYQISLPDREHHKAYRPIQYRIDVRRDDPPNIKFDQPQAEIVSVPVKGQLPIQFHITDDFGLRHVALNAEHGGQPLELNVRLDRLPPEKALTQPFDGKSDFRPAAFGLKKGDEVQYWVEADDNKEPKQNHAETARRTIKIVDDGDSGSGQAKNEQGADGQNQKGEGQPQQGNNPQGKNGDGTGQKGPGASDNTSSDGNKGESSSDNKTASNDGSANKSPKSDQSNKADPSKSGKGSEKDETSSPDSANGQRGEAGSSENGDQSNKRTSPDDQKADAIKDILDHKRKQEQQQNKSEQSGDKSQPDKSQDQSPQNGGNSGGQQQGSNPQDGGQPNGPQKPGAEKGSQQGGQGNSQPQGASGGKKEQGASGNSKSQGNNHGDSAANNTPSQGSKPGGQDAANPGNEKTSPQQGDNTQPPNGGSPSQGDQKTGNKSGTKQSSPQNSGGQNKDQAKTSGGNENGGENAATGNKQENKQAGGSKSQDQSSSGGSQSPKEKAAGGEKGGNQSGNNQSGTEKKPSGSSAGQNDSQIAMNGGKPKEQEKGSSQGSDVKSDMPAGSKPDNKPKPQSSSGGGGQNSPQKQEKKEEGGAGGESGQQKPQPGGEKPDNGGSGKSSPGGAKSEKPGDMANGEQRQMDPGKTGDPTQRDSSGAPDPQVDPDRAGNKAGDAHQGLNPSDKSQSPGNSPHKSDSSSTANGDRKGGGGEGGGEHDKKAGKGSAGSSMNAEHGGSVSDQKGEDATGNKAGEAKTTTNNTASPRKESGTGSGEKTEKTDKQPSNEPQNKQDSATQNASQTPQNAGGQSGAQSSQQAGQHGSGFPAGGSSAGDQPTPPAPENAAQGKADAADEKFAKSQVDMALRHLKDETNKQKSDLLDRLGWTPDEARKFAENIEKLRDSAKQPGSEGQKTYQEFLKDLGLRPHGTRIEGAKTKDDFRGVRDAPQMEPPAEWDEISREYSKATAAGQK